ncbi:MAG: hypothetical protein WCE21_03325 [Candidatus Babeliales bacterium]
MKFRTHILLIVSMMLSLSLHTLDAFQAISRSLNRNSSVHVRGYSNQATAPAHYCPVPLLKQTQSVRPAHTRSYEEGQKQEEGTQGAKEKTRWKKAATIGAGSLFFANYCTTVSSTKEEQKKFFEGEIAEVKAAGASYLKLAQEAPVDSIRADMYYAAYYASLGNGDESRKYIQSVEKKIYTVNQMMVKFGSIGFAMAHPIEAYEAKMAIHAMNNTDVLNVILRATIAYSYEYYGWFLAFKVPHTAFAADKIRSVLLELAGQVVKLKEYLHKDQLQKVIISFNAFANEPTQDHYFEAKKLLPLGTKPYAPVPLTTEQLEEAYPEIPNPYWLD